MDELFIAAVGVYAVVLAATPIVIQIIEGIYRTEEISTSSAITDGDLKILHRNGDHDWAHRRISVSSQIRDRLLLLSKDKTQISDANLSIMLLIITQTMPILFSTILAILCLTTISYLFQQFDTGDSANIRGIQFLFFCIFTLAVFLGISRPLFQAAGIGNRASELRELQALYNRLQPWLKDWADADEATRNAQQTPPAMDSDLEALLEHAIKRFPWIRAGRTL